jgi:hypothetical protein
MGAPLSTAKEVRSLTSRHMLETVTDKSTHAPRKESAWPPAWLLRIPALGKLYLKCERYVPVIVFAVGFIWDSITMTRVDSVIDNMILLGYLTALAFMIFFTVRKQIGQARPKWICRLENYFPWAMQFAFGGLFSSYVIFYFKSVSWTSTQFFFIVLVVLLLGNEFLHDRLLNAKLLAVLYSFCLLSFLSFFLPVVFKRVGTEMFLLAGAFSLVVSTMIFAISYSVWEGNWRKQMASILICIAATYITVNSLYFVNLIPPVPLALKNGGIYHQIRKTSGGYEVQYVHPPYYRFWKQWDNPFFLSNDESAYCFTAIFAPTKIHVPIIHVWSYYSDSTGWHETDRIRFEVSGGREGGYRGFSRKKTLWPGKWCVQVETSQGRILGKIDFEVSPSPNPHPPLETRIIP